MPKQENPYNFILDAKPTRSKGPASLQDPFKRKIMLVLFSAVVLLVVVLLGALIFGGGDSGQDLRAVSSQQTEILRITELGLESAQGSDARRIAATTNAVIASDAAATTKYLENNGIELTPEQKTARLNKKATERLDAAIQRNTFDEEFLRVLEETMNKYKQDVQNSFNAPAGPKKKELLDTIGKNLLTLYPNK